MPSNLFDGEKMNDYNHLGPEKRLFFLKSLSRRTATCYPSWNKELEARKRELGKIPASGINGILMTYNILTMRVALCSCW